MKQIHESSKTRKFVFSRILRREITTPVKHPNAIQEQQQKNEQKDSKQVDFHLPSRPLQEGEIVSIPLLKA